MLVNVNDINDNVPTFPRDYEGPFDVTEGQPGPRVWTFLAHDRDSGPNGQVEYSVVDGDPLGKWGLHWAGGAVITFLRLLRPGVRESTKQSTNHLVTFPLWASIPHAFVTGL